MADTFQTHPSRCLIWGGYGWGNTGDDLTLAVAMKDLGKTFGQHIAVLTPNVQHTGRALPNTRLIPIPQCQPAQTVARWLCSWGDYAALLGFTPLAERLHQLTLRRYKNDPCAIPWMIGFDSASTLHLVGGGYLTDLFDLRPRLRPIWFARAMKLSVTTSPLGLGPFTNPKAARVVARALEGATIRVRDTESLQFCEAHHLQATECPDDAFRLAEVLPAIHAGEDPRSTPPTLGVCVFPQYSGDWSAAIEQWWEDCLRATRQDLPDWNIEGFCFHTDRSMDYHTTRRVFVRAGLNPDNVHTPEKDYRQAVTQMRRFHGVLSTRFHAIVTAAVLRTPSVAVAMNPYYRIKMQSALKHSTTPACLVNPHQDSPQAASQFLSRHLSRSHPVRDP